MGAQYRPTGSGSFVKWAQQVQVRTSIRKIQSQLKWSETEANRSESWQIYSKQMLLLKMAGGNSFACHTSTSTCTATATSTATVAFTSTATAAATSTPMTNRTKWWTLNGRQIYGEHSQSCHSGLSLNEAITAHKNTLKESQPEWKMDKFFILKYFGCRKSLKLNTYGFITYDFSKYIYQEFTLSKT